MINVTRANFGSFPPLLARTLAATTTTTRLIIGDARNYNDPREWCLREDSHQAKKRRLVNPETPSAGASATASWTSTCSTPTVAEEGRNLRPLRKVVTDAL